MITQSIQYQEAIREIERHLEDSEISKLGHWDQAGELGKKHRRYIAIPALILSALLTWLLQNPLYNLLDPSFSKILSTEIPKMLALALTLLTALDLMLGLKSLEAAHRNAALSYQEVWRNCKNWRTDFPEECCADSAAQAARQYRERLTSINRNSPQLPTDAWKRVRQQRESGSVSYKVDTINEK